MTQSASWMERSASSSTSRFEPRTTTVTVRETEEAPVIWGGGEGDEMTGTAEPFTP